MQFSENVSLKSLNTFGIEAKARFYYELHSKQELKEIIPIIDKSEKPLLFLGSGSNILFTKDFDGYVVRIVSKGIRIISTNETECFVEAAAGEEWDSLIQFCIQNNLYGLENLSGIPGTVGSAPVQNIGAYGVEVKDCIHLVNIVMTSDFSETGLTNKECRFAYRDSIFKSRFQYRVLVDSVVFRLSRVPRFVLNYGGVTEEVERISPDSVDLKTVSQAIINIRNRKIPDPKVIGSAGSFFKNPIINQTRFNRIINVFPDLKYFYDLGQNYKLAAAWLIEQCGWKGFRYGDIGVNENQPLILMNFGNASGKDILNLSRKIQQSVLDKFGIVLEPEVNIQ